ncbi:MULTISPECIES: BLUF domain-containing protein [Paracoccaceae]|jgi:hypothetical protein|uniref:BLUF domain-containing protein n=1 Tax=Rhodobacterales TaxID=204455 RepID=UPI001D0B97C8|nr:BLUF domain-containing protein [Boseongicola sp. H5]
MHLVQLIYSSRPFGYDQATLNGILVTARGRNSAAGVTGALICRADLYLQLLEGPEPAVTEIYKSIIRDDRHLDVTLRSDGAVTERLFGEWDMLDDPARGWMWDRDAVADGVLDHATAQEFVSVFRRVRREIPAG